MRETESFEFWSDQFEIDPGEEQQTAHGAHGLALAQWLRAHLAPDGERLVLHDGCWRLMLQREPYGLWISCGNITDMRREPRPVQPLAWWCAVRVDVSFWTGLLRERLLGDISPDDDIRATGLRLAALLRSNPRIWDLTR